MENIELIIKIPKETYNFLKRYGTDGGIIEKSVINGTPLPKRYGRLIDADARRTEVNEEDRWVVDLAPTIIEAKTESEE